MTHVNSEGIADDQTAEGDIESVRLKGGRRVTKHVWRIILGKQVHKAAPVELPRHEGALTEGSPSNRVAREDQNGVTTTLSEPEAGEPDAETSLDRDALIETIGRLAMQASVLTDQLSVMAAQLVDAERAQAKAERGGILALAKLKAAEARLAEQERQHQSELEMLSDQYRAKLADAEATGEHYLAQLRAFGDRALAEIAGLKRQRDQALAAISAFRALPWWRRAFAPGTREQELA